MIGLAALALLIQSPKVGQMYDCKIVKVVDAARFWVKVNGVSRQVSLPGVAAAPKSSWAYEAGREYLFKGFGPGRDKRDPQSLKVRIESMPPKGPMVAELYYVAHYDDGHWTAPKPSDFPVAADLLRCGYVSLTKPDKARQALQATAKDKALGMWKKKLPPVAKGGEFAGSVVKVLSPTRFMVARPWGDGYNTTPWTPVRLAYLIEPPKNSPAYATALAHASRLYGSLRRDTWSGRVESQSYETTFWASSIDRDGTAACAIGYTVYSADTPDGMFRGEPHVYGEDLLMEGLASIDPKAQNVPPTWKNAEASAKAARKGIWASK